jgi:hypothetical protein
MQLRYKVGFLLAVTLAAFLYGRFHKKPDVVPSLPPGTVGQVIVNPHNHTITVTTPTGTHTITLPYQPTPINIRPDGSLTVKAKQVDFEAAPFIGAGYNGQKALVLGLDLLYLKKFDIGAAMVFSTVLARPAVTLSYNVWSNTRITGSLESGGTAGVFITVRL